MGNAWIIGGARTARGRGKIGKGSLSSVHPQELLAQTLNEVVARTKVDAKAIDDVVAGCVSQAKEQGACIARNAVLAAGLPDELTGVTVNRFCGSGLQALNFGAMGVGSGHQGLVLAGGVESMSRVPMGSDEAGIDGNNVQLRKKVFQVPQGISADLIATLEGFSRADVDAFALESQRRAEVAQKENRFAKAMFGAKDPETGKVLLEIDEHARHGTTIEALTKLEPAFVGLGAAAVGPNGETLDQIAMKRYPEVKAINHVHTAGNSSGIVDGACALLLASDDAVKAHGLKPRAKVRAMATIGDEPVIMLTAPARASARALEKAGMKPSDIDLWEINEAFATVPLQTMRKLSIDHAKVNVNGGAIALGHPLGATGAILTLTVLDELERRGLGTALITLCIGGGMGIATVIERV
jgi:acetyl-CoA C-acetyltransferase